MLGFLVMVTLSSGCALGQRAVDYVKDQGMKVLAKKLEKIELKFEAELKQAIQRILDDET